PPGLERVALAHGMFVSRVRDLRQGCDARAPTAASRFRGMQKSVLGSTAETIVYSFDYPPNDGGISRLCAAVRGGLAAKGNIMRVLKRGWRDCEGDSIAPPVPVRRLSSVRPFKEWQAFWALRKLRSGTAVLNGIWFPEGALAMLAGVRPRIILAHG